MPICITGMHRSGTSMVARLLHGCGLDLGAEADLLGPADENPEGYWEHRAFVELNDALLAQLGGRWDVPMVEPAGWETGPAFAPLRERAACLAARFRGREPWGWKDPRNALTLPFWRQVLPDLRVVVCLRHPDEVVRSLARRADWSRAFLLELWRINHERLRAALPADAVCTHYDAYFLDARAELRRLVEHLGLPATEARLAAAVATVAPALRHHRVDATAAADWPPAVRHCYAAWCAEAGPIYRRGQPAPAPRLADAGAGDGSLAGHGPGEHPATDAAPRPATSPRAQTASEAVTMLAPADLRALQQTLAEQTAHLAALTAQLAARMDRETEPRALLLDAHDQLIRRDDEIRRLQARELELSAALDEQARWARRSAAEVGERDAIVRELQERLAEQAAWAQQSARGVAERDTIIRALQARLAEQAAHKRAVAAAARRDVGGAEPPPATLDPIPAATEPSPVAPDPGDGSS